MASTTSAGRITRVALLTPYAGSNLGDAAIQEALIESLRALRPELEIHGINLGPERTSRLHGIEGHLITELNVEFYSSYYFANLRDSKAINPSLEPASSAERGAGTGVSDRPTGGGLREIVKSLPGLGVVLRNAAALARQLPFVAREVRAWGRDGKLVRSLDLLIVAGGGQLDDEWGGPWGHPYALYRWSILARRAGVPFVVLSVGSASLERGLSRRFLAGALRGAAYRSYRDRGTRDALAFVPETSGDPIVPDLALGLDTRTRCSPVDLGPGERWVGISPIAYGHATIWPTREPQLHDRYIGELTAFAQGLLDAGRNLLVYASSGADRKIVSELADRLRERAAEGAGRVVVADVETVEDLLSHLAAVDLVVTSRLHGVILSHVMHTPCLAISFDRKVDAHMEDLDQTRFMVDIRDFSRADLEQLFARLEAGADDVASHLREAVALRRGALERQIESVVALREQADA